MSPENSKPEWFQMSEADGFGPEPRSKRVVRIMALATPLLVLGAGLVFAQTQDSPTAVASASTSLSSPAASADPIALSNTASPSPAAASAPAASTAPTTHVISVSQTSDDASIPKASITITQPGITQPGIAKPGIAKPTGGGEDDGIGRDSDDD